MRAVLIRHPAPPRSSYICVGPADLVNGHWCFDRKYTVSFCASDRSARAAATRWRHRLGIDRTIEERAASPLPDGRGSVPPVGASHA